MIRLVASAAAILSSASFVLGQSSTGQVSSAGAQCGPNNLCPSSTPCCSQYGACGVGAYCLGGCDPMYSFQLDSCTPEPVCQNSNYKFPDLTSITPNTQYLGDPSTASWVSSGTALEAPTNDSVILTLSEDGASASGTLLASAAYVWYGKVTAVMKSSRGAGVVSAFILLSDNKDEIDFEFIGTDLQTVQSNFYWQGVTNYENEKNLSVSGGDTFSTFHTYEIDWQPDTLTWSVDGNVMRTLKKSDTFNKTDNQYHYPQTPARVELSLWPAGLQKNGEGTVAWAGGLIDWNGQDAKTNGYYYSLFKSITVECYNAPSDASVSGTKSYLYTDRKGLESSIAVTNNNTILKSLLGTGTNMDKDYPSAAASGKGASQTSTVATVPGLTGAGPGTDGTRGGGSNDGSGSSSGGSSAAGANGASSTGIGGFTQGNQKTGSAAKGETVIKGSAFAALVAFVAILLM